MRRNRLTLPFAARRALRTPTLVPLLLLLGLAGLLAGSACAPASSRGAGSPAASDEDLQRLAGWMTGFFSSAAQAAADSAYYDIRLVMTPIWSERSDGLWLYVEQAVAGREAQPYRQRVYRLRRVSAERLESAVFQLAAPERFAGAWRTPQAFSALTPDSLAERAGCAILLEPRGRDEFAGSTVDRGCPSELRGASYATSEVVIRADRMVSWDRGFDAEGRQVWGAETGGYVFDKLTGSE